MKQGTEILATEISESLVNIIESEEHRFWVDGYYDDFVRDYPSSYHRRILNYQIREFTSIKGSKFYNEFKKLL